jgi:hypothetical protein
MPLLLGDVRGNRGEMKAYQESTKAEIETIRRKLDGEQQEMETELIDVDHKRDDGCVGGLSRRDRP